MKITLENEWYLSAALDYILEHEAEDFSQWPSDTHPYFCAYVFVHGLSEAQKLLKETEKALE